MSQPVISVLLPTVRPDLALRALSSLVHAARDIPYEAVVVADFPESSLGCCAPTSHLHTVWVERERRGVVDAVNAACETSQGDYWFLFNDESLLEADALKLLLKEAQQTPRCLYGPRHVPAYTFVYFGQPFVPFPFVHRRVATELGGLLDAAYGSFYADPDLSLRAHAAGIPVRVVEDAVITHHNGQDEAKQTNMSRYMVADQRTFRQRWGHLGPFSDC